MRQSWEMFSALREACTAETLKEYLGCDRSMLWLWTREGTPVARQHRASCAALALAWGVISQEEAISWAGLGPERIAQLAELPRRGLTLGEKLKEIAESAGGDLTPVELHQAALDAGITLAFSTVYKLIQKNDIPVDKRQGNFTKGKTRRGSPRKRNWGE